MSEHGNLTDEFTSAWWAEGLRGGTWQTTTWFGAPVQKHPFDLMMFQEIVWATRPQLIIETGTCRGGSARFYATLLDSIGEGDVLTVDITAQPDLPQHPRIHYRTGSSVATTFLDEAEAWAGRVERTMVVLDSDHRAPHVAAELVALSALVTPGCYLVCEDSCVNGHPLAPDFGPGPHEALDGFLAGDPPFDVDRDRERLWSTFNPQGYLRRRG